MELVDRLAEAAKRTDGTFTFRNGKLFGNFIIIVNKAQDIKMSDQETLEHLIKNNPSLISKINKYFTGGPEVVLLPRLVWDYNDQPDFNEDGEFCIHGCL